MKRAVVAITSSAAYLRHQLEDSLELIKNLWRAIRHSEEFEASAMHELGERGQRIEGLAKQNADLQAANAILTTDKKSLEESSRSLTLAGEQIQAANGILISKVDRLQKDNASLTATIESLQTENNSLTSKVEALQQDNKALTSSVEGLRTDNGTLTSNIEGLKKDIVDLKEDNEKLKTDKSSLKKWRFWLWWSLGGSTGGAAFLAWELMRSAGGLS